MTHRIHYQAQCLHKHFKNFSMASKNGCTHAVSAVMSVKFDIRLSSPKPTKISPISFTLHSLFHSRARSCSAIFLWTFYSSIISRPSEIMPKLISWLITSLVLGWNLSPMLVELMAWCDDVNEREKNEERKTFAKELFSFRVFERQYVVVNMFVWVCGWNPRIIETAIIT